SLTTDAVGATTFNGGSVTTTGTQTYKDVVSLLARAALTSTGGGALRLADTVDVGAGLTISTAGTTVFNGSIIDSGTLTLNGTGVTTLSAVNTHSGATTVNAGILLVNGSHVNSTTTVNSGATL